MSLDILGRNKAPSATEIYGACRCCWREFVDNVTTPLTQCRHERDGYCQACNKRSKRTGGTPRANTLVPPGAHRDGFTVQENTYHLIGFLNRIEGASKRPRTYLEVHDEEAV